MKIKLTVILTLICLAFCSCRSTEEIIQQKGFRPWPKSRASGYEQCTRNYIGYGTYQAPDRRGVDK